MGETYQVSLFLLLFFTTSFFVAGSFTLLASSELASEFFRIPSLLLFYLHLTTRFGFVLVLPDAAFLLRSTRPLRFLSQSTTCWQTISTRLSASV
jgi:hypothetical protein